MFRFMILLRKRRNQVSETIDFVFRHGTLAPLAVPSPEPCVHERPPRGSDLFGLGALNLVFSATL